MGGWVGGALSAADLREIALSNDVARKLLKKF